MIERSQATEDEIHAAFEALMEAVRRRIQKHGRGKWVSPHEGLGVMAEEYKEVVDEVHNNDRAATVREFIDCAVTGIWAYVSLHDDSILPEDGHGSPQHKNTHRTPVDSL